MRKALLVTVGFLVFALLGPILLALVAITTHWIWLRLHPPTQSGIGAVAGGLSELAVTSVPILFGIIGALATAQRIGKHRP